MEDRKQIAKLFQKYLDQQCTAEELDKILWYFQLTEHDEQLVQLIEKELDQNIDEGTELIRSIGDTVAHNLFNKTRPQKKTYSFKRWLPYAAAVLLLAVSAMVLYQYTVNSHPSDDSSKNTFAGNEIILPGGNRATVTLENGQVLTLSEDQEAVINTGDALAYADGTPIQHLDKAQLVTLATPRAGQYSITLSDGTKVWLNAASELIYPTHFEGNERHVQVKGEAYFEVAHDKHKPFIVQTDQQSIQVLGTRFNIHAYTDEAVQHTTLVEGSVKVKSNADQNGLQLRPGQQAVSKTDGGLSIVQVDPKEFTSWKDGIILLNSYDLPEILRQLERWYDVKFDEIPKGVKTDRVFGMIHRDVPLNDVLQTLKDNYNTMNFKINGRRIMISTQ